jgi:RNA polymerase sigma factor (TIGR02999 family)
MAQVVEEIEEHLFLKSVTAGCPLFETIYALAVVDTLREKREVRIAKDTARKPFTAIQYEHFGGLMSSQRRFDEDQPGTVGILIQRCNGGDSRARELLVERFYTDLRRIAAAQLQLERRNHTLQPTALVHEAYARFVRQSEVRLEDRSHFLATAAQLMRQILVDHARARLASKRGGAQHQVTLDEGLLAERSRPMDILVLDQALQRLSELDARHGRIVEMHFFGGLTFNEIARVVGVNERTVRRDWAMARAWLRNELSLRP